MKHVILLLSLCTLAFASCQKKQCYTCTMLVTTTPTHGAANNSSSTTVCDMTERDKEMYEKGGSFVTTGQSASVTIKTTVKTVCNY